MDKISLRRHYKRKREDIPFCDRQKLNEKIDANFKSFIDEIPASKKQQISTINCFLNSDSKHEISTIGIINSCIEMNWQITVPVSNYEDCSIKAARFDSDTQIQKDQYGIPEPITPLFINEKDINLIVIPLLVADKKGFRVGYGKGMYDRFIPSCNQKAIKVGLSLFPTIDEIQGTDNYDQKLDYLITPEEIVQF